ncbi:hypothetical protein ARMGADRAFT_1033061 [Armillaria gallica]|uniref:Uncharacterized protein n=1 Tax=Armillaria gallica TaxID=47427 RepID=A0A2H3D2I1_ARMGA|nr:hypothetical protein ARMGADRAFT_1033061 [Armillaria gallica]
MDWHSDLMKKALSDCSLLSRDEAPRYQHLLIKVQAMMLTFSFTTSPSSSSEIDKHLFAKHHHNLAIELLDLPPEWDKQSYYLKIFAGNVYKKTKTYKVKKKDHGTTSTPRWTLDLDLKSASDYSSITQSASEDQDMATTPQSSPLNTADPKNQDTSDLSGLQSKETSTILVEDYHATVEEDVEAVIWYGIQYGCGTRKLPDMHVLLSLICLSLGTALCKPSLPLHYQGHKQDDMGLHILQASPYSLSILTLQVRGNRLQVQMDIIESEWVMALQSLCCYSHPIAQLKTIDTDSRSFNFNKF